MTNSCLLRALMFSSPVDRLTDDRTPTNLGSPALTRRRYGSLVLLRSLSLMDAGRFLALTPPTNFARLHTVYCSLSSQHLPKLSSFPPGRFSNGRRLVFCYRHTRFDFRWHSLFLSAQLHFYASSKWRSKRHAKWRSKRNCN